MFPDWVYEMQDRWYILKAGLFRSLISHLCFQEGESSKPEADYLLCFFFFENEK